jgi:hypothetical protein
MATGDTAMRLLRDESGYLAALRNPFASKATTAEQATDGVVTHPAPVLKAFPAVTSHCCFFCLRCGAPIPLPHDQIGLPFAQPALRRIEVRSIASVCRSCKHVGNYSLFRGCPGYDTRHKLMPAPISGKTILVEWLQCDAPGCPFRVPLFVNFESGLSPEDAAKFIAGWIWHDLKCMSGHRIRRAVSAPHRETATGSIQM